MAADFFREEYNVDYTLATLNEERMKGNGGSSNIPVQVSLWDGIVMGGGVGISAHGSYRIATERTLVSALIHAVCVCVSQDYPTFISIMYFGENEDFVLLI